MRPENAREIVQAVAKDGNCPASNSAGESRVEPAGGDSVGQVFRPGHLIEKPDSVGLGPPPRQDLGGSLHRLPPEEDVLGPAPQQRGIQETAACRGRARGQALPEQGKLPGGSGKIAPAPVENPPDLTSPESSKVLVELQKNRGHDSGSSGRQAVGA